MRRPYRLGLDVGSNSLGWWMVWLDGEGLPVGLGPGGVRIYPDGRDPQSKTSNAVQRRVARGARRRRDRYLKRREKLMALLVQHGLMPEDEAARKALEKLDPYELRAGALDGALPAHHLGRALFHLDQRRGFQSNRKTEKGDKEAGVIKEAAGRLEAKMAEEHARTLGEFLHRRHRDRDPVRARNRSTGTKADYEFYPTRQMVLDEFNMIWDAQARHHPSLTAEARAAICHAVFDQRPLKQPPVGKCSLDPAHDNSDTEGFRCAWAHPLAQRFRIWQEVRNLEIVESGKNGVCLTKEQGDKIALALLQTGKFSFDKMRAQLALPSDAKFNLESDKRQELLGDQTAAKLAGKAFFGKAWRSFPLPRQIDIVSRLLDEQDDAKLIEWLVAEADLDFETAERVASAFLPDGHCRLGLRAIRKLVPLMEGGRDEHNARITAYPAEMRMTGERLERLPYYGEWLQDDVLGSGDPRDGNDKRWGRFPNPTVHIGLGQLRRIVNDLIREYGPPAQIAVEMTRDFKLSPDRLAKVEKEQADNQRKNDARRQTIREHGQAENVRNTLKLRLWEELSPDGLDRICPYTGERISVARLLSEEVDIDHLIPYQDSWDDSAANKTVCMTYANRAKGNRTPYEAFGSRPEWPEISSRATSLPKNKRWRFQPDARDRFNAAGGFLARQLNETGWLARVAKHYLAAVTDPYKINVLPGKLTALIRGKWGLNGLLPDHNYSDYSDAKNRKDHRHHAIDALVAAMTDRSLLHRMSSAYDVDRERIEVPKPWETLRDDLKVRLDAMTVSHKPDHGLQAQLHEDTAYGVVKDSKKEGGNLVYRKAFHVLKEKEIERIRDRRLRDMLKAYIADAKVAGKDLKTALQEFSKRNDIPGIQTVRHVRLLKQEKAEYLVPVKADTGRPYKSFAAGQNAFIEIFETSDGKWRGEGISMFKANQKNAAMEWLTKFPGARLVMRVFKGDLVALDWNGKRTVMVVKRLEAAHDRLLFAAHNEAGDLDGRDADKNDPFGWLQRTYNSLKKLNPERVRVDELGRVWRVRRPETPRTPELA